MARAKSELSEAKRSAEELALRVVESRVRARARKKEISRLKKPAVGEEEWALANGEVDNHQYMEVTRELETAKQDLSNMKLDMASAVRMKKKAEEETKVLGLKMESYLKSMEELEKEVEEANEEHVLVELARIEASKECREIEAQRKAEAKSFSQKMEEAKARMKDLIKEVNHTEELEMKLATTTSDLDVLQNEMVFVRAMGKNLAASNKGSPSKKKRETEMESMHSLQTAKTELETAKEELASVKEEGFRFMLSMDLVREEVNRVSNEASRLKILEEKTDITVQNLNSKLLRAKSKLEAASVAGQKSKAIVSNLSATMERLQSDKEEAKKQQEQMITESESFKSEIEKDESNMHGMKERLLAAMQELEALKASEAVALEMLKILSEKTMSRRAPPVQNRTTTTISKFEYNYLSKCAEGAQGLADKKVAAAQAWIAALKASEKETLLQSEIVQKEMQEIKDLQGKEIHKLDEALMTKKGEQHNRKLDRESLVVKSLFKKTPPRKSLKETGVNPSSRRSKTRRRSITPGKAFVAEIEKQFDTSELESDPEAVKLHLIVTPPRKSFKGNTATPSRKSNVRRRSSSSGVRVLIGPPSVVSKKNRKVVPSLVKFLTKRRAGKQNLQC